MNGSDTATLRQRLDTHKRFSFFSKPITFFAAIALAFGLLSHVACGGSVSDNFSTYANSSSAYSVFASNGDVHVAGLVSMRHGSNEYPVAALWKNPRPKDPPYYLSGMEESYATSVFVANNHVYVAGAGRAKDENNGLLAAALWTDGSPKYWGEKDDRFTWLGITSLFVSGEDVYIAGRGRSYKQPKVKALLWENGVIQPLTAESDSSEAYSVYVSGNYVYVAGSDGDKAVLWKNGVAKHLSDGSSPAAARSVFVSGGDVYVAGADGRKAVLWKNGVAEYLDGDSRGGSSANSVFVSGGNVYVAGEDRWNAILWSPTNSQGAALASMEKTLLAPLKEND